MAVLTETFSDRTQPHKSPERKPTGFGSAINPKTELLCGFASGWAMSVGLQDDGILGKQFVI